MSEVKFVIEKSPRIARLIHDLYANMPEIEADRAELVTESYKQTEHQPILAGSRIAVPFFPFNESRTARESAICFSIRVNESIRA